MRWLTNAILALTLLAMGLGLTWHRREAQSQQFRVETVRNALRAIQSEAIYHPAVDQQVDAEPTGFAKNINPDWFRERPGNALLEQAGVRCPWIDQPIGTYRNRFNPVYIVADKTHAAFWYNPFRGVIRARVPMQLSQQATIELYNRVNGTALHPDEVGWHKERNTAWVDVGPPETLVNRIEPSSPAPSPSPGNKPSSGDSSGDKAKPEPPMDPVLRDFGGS